MRKILLTSVLIINNLAINAQWIPLDIDSTAVTSFAIKDSFLFAGSGKDIYMSSDEGNSWTNKGLNNVRCLAVKDNYLFAGRYQGVYRTTYDGNDWIQLNNGLTPPLGTIIRSFKVDGSNIWVSTEGGVFYSTDNGENWNSANNSLPSYIISLEINGSSIFAGHGDGQGIFLSTNNGISWTQKNGGLPGGTSVPELAVHNGNVYAGTYTGIYVTSDNGSNWISISNGLPNLEVSAFAFLGNNIFAGINNDQTNSGGVFQSINNGNSWVLINEGLGTKEIGSLIIHNEFIFAGTYSSTGSAVWRRPLSEIITTVEPLKEILPTKLELQQNFPNPFNPSTNIQYTISNRQFVTLKVCDLLGREVATLVNEEKAPGNYQAIFDASALSNGVYFYRLQAGNFVQTRKMILMK